MISNNSSAVLQSTRLGRPADLKSPWLFLEIGILPCNVLIFKTPAALCPLRRLRLFLEIRRTVVRNRLSDLFLCFQKVCLGRASNSVFTKALKSRYRSPSDPRLPGGCISSQSSSNPVHLIPWCRLHYKADLLQGTCLLQHQG
jgi:hypothetical protein